MNILVEEFDNITNYKQVCDFYNRVFYKCCGDIFRSEFYSNLLYPHFSVFFSAR